LNHGSFGACQKEVIKIQYRYRELMEREPVYFMTYLLEGLLDESRDELAKLIRADQDGLVFLTNATTAVNTVLNSIRLKAGDELIITNHGYNACNNAVRYYAKIRRLKVKVLNIPFPIESEEEIITGLQRMITNKSRFILIDHITSPTALKLPLEQIVKICSDSGIDIMVDGAHSVGMIPLDIKKLGVQYYTSNCHKWLFAPKGSAFLYVREDKRDNIYPLIISHGLNSERRDRSRFHLLFDWTGTQDFTPYICIKSAIRFANTIRGSIDNLMKENHQRVLVGRDILLESLKIKKPAPDYMLGSMASIILPQVFGKFDKVDLQNRTHLQRILFEKYHIEVPVIKFNDRLIVRISAQVYN
jgi:isopenicillin-N epimerase